MRYFRPEEFDCKCKKCKDNGEGRGVDMMEDYFLQMLDDARHKAGIPFVITSGYRCPSHNRAVGGVANSAHTKGLAADIACSDERSRGYIIGALYEASFNRIGIHPDFIHVDDDDSRSADVVWLYKE
jgi:zinc D-Ala-D-Ala carboxypeptidase